MAIIFFFNFEEKCFYQKHEHLEEDQKDEVKKDKIEEKSEENNEKAKEEIQNEAKLMKSLNSPFIIKYLGLCYTTTDKRKYLNIVLEFAKLGSLHSYLRKHREFPMKKISKILYQIASAMEYLTSKKIVHRNLAARNVLLVNENSAKVGSFTQARLANSDGEYMQDLREQQWPFRWFSPELMESGKIR